MLHAKASLSDKIYVSRLSEISKLHAKLCQNEKINFVCLVFQLPISRKLLNVKKRPVKVASMEKIIF